jgi:Peroxisomal membrane protein (Pex16)
MNLGCALQAMHEAASALSFSQCKQSPRTPGTSSGRFVPEDGKGVWWQSDGVAHKRASQTGVYDADMRPFGSEIENESPNAAGTPTGGASTIKAGFLWQNPPPQSGTGSSAPQHVAPSPTTPSTSQSQQQHRLLRWKSVWSGQSAERSRLESPADACRKRARQLRKLGESLAIIRPLLYVTLLRRYGSRSWVPWTVALMVEGLSHTLTTIATHQLRKVRISLVVLNAAKVCEHQAS